MKQSASAQWRSSQALGGSLNCAQWGELNEKWLVSRPMPPMTGIYGLPLLETLDRVLVLDKPGSSLTRQVSCLIPKELCQDSLFGRQKVGTQMQGDKKNAGLVILSSKY